YGPERARRLYLATIDAVEHVCRLIRRERIHCELEMAGHLIVARSAADRARVAAQGALFRELGLPGEVIDDTTLDSAVRLARVRAPKIAGPAALRLPVAGTLHPMQLLAGLAERVLARDGTIFEGARVLTLRGRQPVRLELYGGGEVIADHVVIATAGYKPQLGVLRGRR